MPLRTWYFAPKSFSAGELSQLLKDVIGCFSPHPDQAHLAVNFSMSDGWDIDKEWASFEDLEVVTNLAESGLSIRAWFQSSDERLYLGIGGGENVIRITISADSIDSAKQLLETLLNKLELVEVRNPLDEHIERMEKLDECPYDFARIVRDPELANILISRWKESNHTYEAQSYLATIILLGSILEGALLDKACFKPTLQFGPHAARARSA